MIQFNTNGSFRKTNSFLDKLRRKTYLSMLDHYGRIGVSTLSGATPVESGETARSWSYEISTKPGVTSLIWSNSHENDNVNIAIILQYGHGTGTGGLIQGRDYINPAIRPVFDKLLTDLWKKVTNG